MSEPSLIYVRSGHCEGDRKTSELQALTCGGSTGRIWDCLIGHKLEFSWHLAGFLAFHALIIGHTGILVALYDLQIW